MSTRKPRQEHADEDERTLGALLERLRPRERARPGWEHAFAARVLARWPVPLVPAAAAALAVAIVLAGDGGFSATPGLQDGSEVEAVLSGDPLSAVVSDPVLALIAADGTAEVTP